MNRMNFGGKLAKWFLTAAAWAFCLTGTALAAGNMPEAVDGTKGVNTRENYENLFDGSTGTKWCVRGTNPYVIFKLPSSVSVTGYTLVTGNDSASCAGRNPHSWTLYGCNASSEPDEDYSGWTEIASVTEDDTMENKNSRGYSFSVDGAAPAYQYYKFQVDKKNALMQLSELILEYPGSGHVLQQAEDGADGVNIAENYDRAADGKASTKWCTSKANPWLTVKMSSPIPAEGYHMVTGNDNSIYKGRNPKSWRIYGCNASQLPDPYDSRWVLLDTVTDDTVMQDVNGTDYYFALPQTSAAYNYYMLWIDEKNSGIMQLSEFSIAYEGSSFGFTGLDGSAASAASSGSGTGQLLCASCAGRGTNHCFVCQGSGVSGTELCRNCNGAGEVRCTACAGRGYIR